MAGEDKIQADAGLGSVSGTVSTLSAGGYTLGEVRYEDQGRDKYRLLYNAGTDQIGKGWIVSKYASCGPYSVSITNTLDGPLHIGGALVQHATVATGYYFWGMVRGSAACGVMGSDTSVSIGLTFGVLGTGSVAPITTVSTYVPVGIAVSTITTGHTGTAGTRTGRVYIKFE
jgi:hypothetical protein